MQSVSALPYLAYQVFQSCICCILILYHKEYSISLVPRPSVNMEGGLPSSFLTEGLGTRLHLHGNIVATERCTYNYVGTHDKIE